MKSGYAMPSDNIHLCRGPWDEIVKSKSKLAKATFKDKTSDILTICKYLDLFISATSCYMVARSYYSGKSNEQK